MFRECNVTKAFGESTVRTCFAVGIWSAGMIGRGSEGSCGAEAELQRGLEDREDFFLEDKKVPERLTIAVGAAKQPPMDVRMYVTAYYETAGGQRRVPDLVFFSLASSETAWDEFGSNHNAMNPAFLPSGTKEVAQERLMKFLRKCENANKKVTIQFKTAMETFGWNDAPENTLFNEACMKEFGHKFDSTVPDSAFPFNPFAGGPGGGMPGGGDCAQN